MLQMNKQTAQIGLTFRQIQVQKTSHVVSFHYLQGIVQRV